MTPYIPEHNGWRVELPRISASEARRDFKKLGESLKTFTGSQEELDNIRSILSNCNERKRLVVHEDLVKQVFVDAIDFAFGSYQAKNNPDLYQFVQRVLGVLSQIESNIGNLKDWEKDSSRFNLERTGWFKIDPNEHGGKRNFASQRTVAQFLVEYGYAKVAKGCFGGYNTPTPLRTCTRYELLDKFYSLKQGPVVPLERNWKDVRRIDSRLAELDNVELIRFTSLLTTTVTKTAIRKCKKRVWSQSNMESELRSSKGGYTPEEYVVEYNTRSKSLNEEVGMDLAQARVLLRIHDRDFEYLIQSIKYDNYGGRTYDALTAVAKSQRGALRAQNCKIIEVDASEMNFYIAYQEFGKVCKAKKLVPSTLLMKAIKSGNLRAIIARLIDVDFTHSSGWTCPFSQIVDAESYLKYKPLVKKFMLVASNCKAGHPAAVLFDKALTRIDFNFGQWWKRRRAGLRKGMSALNALMAQNGEAEFMLGYKLVHSGELAEEGLDPEDIRNYLSERRRTVPGVAEIAVSLGVSWLKINHDSIWIKASDKDNLRRAFALAAIERGFGFAPALKVETFDGKPSFPIKNSSLLMLRRALSLGWNRVELKENEENPTKKILRADLNKYYNYLKICTVGVKNFFVFETLSSRISSIVKPAQFLSGKAAKVLLKEQVSL